MDASKESHGHSLCTCQRLSCVAPLCMKTGLNDNSYEFDLFHGVVIQYTIIFLLLDLVNFSIFIIVIMTVFKKGEFISGPIITVKTLISQVKKIL